MYTYFRKNVIQSLRAAVHLCHVHSIPLHSIDRCDSIRFEFVVAVKLIANAKKRAIISYRNFIQYRRKMKKRKGAIS